MGEWREERRGRVANQHEREWRKEGEVGGHITDRGRGEWRVVREWWDGQVEAGERLTNRSGGERKGDRRRVVARDGAVEGDGVGSEAEGRWQRGEEFGRKE